MRFFIYCRHFPSFFARSWTLTFNVRILIHCALLSLSLSPSLVRRTLSLSPFIYFSFLGPVRQFSWYRLSKCEVKISYNLVVLLSLVFPRLHKINEIVSLQHVFTKLFDIENLFRLVQLFFLCVLKRENNKQAGRQADEKNICETQNNVSCE